LLYKVIGERGLAAHCNPNRRPARHAHGEPRQAHVQANRTTD